MRIMSFFTLVLSLQVSATAYSQKVTLSGEGLTLKQVFKAIEKQTGLEFLYNKDVLRTATPVTIHVKDASPEEVMNICMQNQRLVYTVRNNVIVVFPAPNPAPAPEPAPELLARPHPVKGVITDEKGKPLPGVSISIKGTDRGTFSDAKGEYLLSAVNDTSVLVFSFVGYKTREMAVKGRSVLDLAMAPAVADLGDVEIHTGIVNRKRENFTGAVFTATGDELKRIGNQNVLQSLKTLDPSFIIVDNNSTGSNPNTVPKVEIRGQTSIAGATLKDAFGGDPNSPLFILDGFETDIQTVVKLDMNRIETLTLLKDAASTALYGAKAANGVVVIVTRRPKAGKIRVSYNADFQVQAPDFSDYNLMNASEKLQFEKLVGVYGMPPFSPVPTGNQLYYDSIYYSKLAIVKSGVNTNWLRVPTRTGFSNSHSLYIDGGSQEVTFGVGLNYGDIAGVMKGSGTKNWGTNFDLIYRKNRLNVTNKLYLSGFSSKESPYGSFVDYALANPYYTPRDAEGGIDKYLDGDFTFNDYQVANPLYNGSLGSKDGTSNFAVLNNLMARYTLNPEMAVQAGLSINKSGSTREAFVSPLDTRFDAVSVFQRGQYTNTRSDQSGYTANLALTYAKIFDRVHQLTADVRTQVEERRQTAYTTVAVGFPAGSSGDPSFAFSYAPYQAPDKISTIYRRNTVLGSINYSYDRRYLLDANYNIDGSTAFGVDKKYHSFWSVGVGWNLHNDFHFRSKAITLLKLRANMGLTGNQSLGNTSSVSVYGYDPNTNTRGQGAVLQSLANPGLEWQNTLQTSIGADIALWKNRFSGTVNFFKKATDPLIVVLDLPSSTGISGYPANVGKLTGKGTEVILRFSPIYKPEQQVVWTIGLQGSYTDLKYSGFSNKLSALNQKEALNSSLIRYTDGFSPNDIWAVPSLGIDPGTGNEVFLSKTGQRTMNYNVDDAVKVGSSRPTMQGVISTTVNYKGFLLDINLRYSFGADIYNEALYDKVENIVDSRITQNLDKRALYDRWFKPGDVAKYKVVYLQSQTIGSLSPISSRFVQRENFISGESIGIGYQPFNKQWVQRLGLESVHVNARVNDFFRLSTIKSERGIDYPFANIVSFSIGASF